MSTCDSFLQTLEMALQNPPSPQEIKEIGCSPFLEDHELIRATYALLCRKLSLPLPSLDFKQCTSGAIPLYKRLFYPWGALPFPKEHARLACLLSQIGEKEIAEKMACWQRMTLDHHLNPIFSLFLQESSSTYRDIKMANDALFAMFPDYEPLNQYIDSDHSIVRYQTKDSTIISTGSGCKSGLGAFLYKDIGIVNYAPQFLPFDTFSGFGLAGRPLQCEAEMVENGFNFNFQTRLAAANPHHAGVSGLNDSGYSALWANVHQQFRDHSIQTNCLFEGVETIEKIVFSVFGKAKSCYVAGSHKLNPRSLDRYQGPVQKIELIGEEGKIEIEALSGFSKMQIIPLAGDDSFWGADFLIVYTLYQPEVKFVFSHDEE